MAVSWQELESKPQSERDIYPGRISRAKIRGGWLVYIWEPANGAPALTFIPDPEHLWDGSSPP